MFSKLLFLFLFVCLLFQVGKGQQLLFEHFTVDDGLPSNEVYQVAQDTTGKLLIATDRGGVHFDGYSFSSIPLESKLSGKPVYFIYQQPGGSAYFSSLQGLIYQYKKDSLFPFPFNRQTAGLFKHPGILIANAISAYRDTLWISFNNDYNYNTKIGSCYVTQKGIVGKIEPPDGLYFDLRRQFYFRQSSPEGNSSKQPLFIHWEDGAVTKDEVEVNWRGKYIRRLFYNPLGNYHLFSIGRQLLVYKDRKKISSHLFPENVLSVTPLSDSEFYVGFENKGASLFRLQEGIVTAPANNLLNGYSVSCVYKDSQGGLWLSTLENGLFYSRPSHTKYWENNSRIVALQKRKNRVYAGYYDGRIQVFSADSIVAESRVPLMAGGYLYGLSFDHNDSLIVITDKGYYTRPGGRWQFIKGSDAVLLAADAHTLYGASASSAELRIYNGLGKGIVQQYGLSKRIISMFTGSPEELWIGTWDGLLHYKAGSVADMSRKSAVFNDRIVSIGQLSGNRLVVASLGNGLAVMKDKTIGVLTIGNGLRSPVINSMVINNDSIWIGTNRGLTMATFTDGRFSTIHMGLESGLPTLDIQQFSVNNGWLYLKWFNKLTVLRTANLLSTDNATKTTITNVLADGESPSYSPGSRFAPGQNSLTFHFNCINLSSALQQQFAYRLEGLDKSWHQTKERYAKYTNLPPGHYRFRVAAMNQKDGTLAAPASFSFFIRPAFWQQWWFAPLVAGLVLSILILLFRMRLQAVRRKNDLLLELAENRQKVLVQLIHPHFVFNVLNTIQGAILKQDKMIAASLIARFAKLMRLSMELSKEKWVSLQKEMELLQKYFELEEVRSPGTFHYAIDAMPPLQPAGTLIPSMLIQPFVENAIKHGIMHLSGKKGAVHIQLRFDGALLFCIVDDNGVGRRESERINRASRNGHQSSGIEITINRLRLLHQEQKTSFRYEVIDKMNEQGEAEGTRISFSIPYKTAYETDSRPDY